MMEIKNLKAKMDNILEAIPLGLSSFGLLPYSILSIENRKMLKKIKSITMPIAQVRMAPVDSLKPDKEQIEAQLKNGKPDNLIWRSKETYIELGMSLMVAALEKIDRPPMKGFDKTLLHDLLKQKENRLHSLELMAFSHQDAKNDSLVNHKMVRPKKENLFFTIPIKRSVQIFFN